MSNWLRNLGSDFPASIVVLLVALPLCLGIALGSNAPLFSGIVAGIVGGIVVGILSGSPLSVSGPAAGLTVIVAAGIASLQTFEAFLLAVALAGLFQIVLGYLRAGVIGDYVPNSVIKGMLAAIGLILILKQFPHLIGYDADFEGDESFLQPDQENTFTELLHAVGFLEVGAVVIGVTGLLILILWETPLLKKWSALKYVPGPLVAVIVGTIINELFRNAGSPLALYAEHLVGLPVSSAEQPITAFLASPDFSRIADPAVWRVAVTLALVASLETLLSIEAVDKLDPLRRATPNNRELKAQGVGNLVSGLLGGLPVTSVIVRSSANVNSGARTKLSTILHGVLMLLCVLFVPFIINKIPLAALAAILIFTGYKLAKISLFKELFAKGYDQFVPFVVTILAILFTDLLTGVIIGLFVGLFFMVRSNFRSSVTMINDDHHYLFRLRKDVSFLNKPIVKTKLESVPSHSYVVIDTTRADFIDQDVIETVNEFILHAPTKDIQVEVKRSLHKPMHLLFHDPTPTGRRIEG